MKLGRVLHQSEISLLCTNNKEDTLIRIEYSLWRRKLFSRENNHSMLSKMYPFCLSVQWRPIRLLWDR